MAARGGPATLLTPDLTPDLTSPILTYLEAGYTPKPGTRRLPLDAWQANRITA